MGAFLNILTSRLGAIGGWLMVAALGVALAWTSISAAATEHTLKGQVSSLQASIDDPKTGFRAQVATYRANVADFEAKTDAANKQVEAWKAAAATASAKASALAAQARAASSDAAKRAVVTLSLKPGADHCASALELIRSP